MKNQFEKIASITVKQGIERGHIRKYTANDYTWWQCEGSHRHFTKASDALLEWDKLMELVKQNNTVTPFTVEYLDSDNVRYWDIENQVTVDITLRKFRQIVFDLEERYGVEVTWLH